MPGTRSRLVTVQTRPRCPAPLNVAVPGLPIESFYPAEQSTARALWADPSESGTLTSGDREVVGHHDAAHGSGLAAGEREGSRTLQLAEEALAGTQHEWVKEQSKSVHEVLPQ